MEDLNDLYYFAQVVERNRSEPQGVVHISCPTALLDFWVGQMLTRFMLAYPLVEMHIESTNRQVDLIQEGIDIALRVRFPPLEDTDLVMKPSAWWPARRCWNACLRYRGRRTWPACRACTGGCRCGSTSGNWMARTGPARRCATIPGW